MKKFKLNPTGTMIVQLPAGVAVDAINDNGIIYVPILNQAGGIETADSDDEPAAKKSGKSAPAAAPAKPGKKAAPVAAADDDDEDEEDDDDQDGDDAPKEYTAKQLKAIDDKDELLAILKQHGIDATTHEGKNTAEKYRRLILAAQAGEIKADAPTKPAKGKPAPAAAGKKKTAPAPVEDDDDEDEEEDEDDSVNGQIQKTLGSLDAQDITVKKAVTAIMKLGSKGNIAKVTKLVNEFSEDEDSDIEATAAQLEAEVTGVKPGKKTAKKEEPAAKGKKGKPAPEEEEDEDDDDDEEEGDDDEGEEVEPEDLEVGDVVNVFWVAMDEWYPGKVKSKKKGKIVIAYDDNTEEVLDADAHTKILRYAQDEE